MWGHCDHVLAFDFLNSGVIVSGLEKGCVILLLETLFSSTLPSCGFGLASQTPRLRCPARRR